MLPRFIFELPNLQDLNLSHNKIEEIPAIKEWPFCMTSLNLYDNKLTSLPSKITALSVLSLNIGNNSFSTVPLCICSFTTLQSLDLSDNPDIAVLPAQMGQLGSLSQLNLKGLKKLKDPPRSVRTDCSKCISYLNEKLKRFTVFYGLKLIVVGHAKRGKSTLVARLQGREDTTRSGAGLNVSKWSYRPSVARRTFHFTVWDFDSKQECYDAHQCFFSQNAIYLVLFNLLHSKKAVEELHFWLNSIAFRAPQSCVIIVGTHLDQIAEESRGPGEGDALLRSVSELATVYKNRLLIVEIVPVALENRIENVNLLREAIYNHAAKYKNDSHQLIMGQRVPASYHTLVKLLGVIREEKGTHDPVMHAKHFKSIMNGMNLTDIVENDSELKKAMIFLTETGSLLHYDERGHGLYELYFIDPAWLYEIVCNTVIKGKNKTIENGILLSEDFGLIMQDQSFPLKYVEQYLALLDRFEIALPLDNRRLLIPSKLPTERKFSDKREFDCYSRHFVFSSASPPGLWSRLLIHSMYTIEKISFALDKIVPVQQNGNSIGMHVKHQLNLPNTWVLPNFPQPRHLDLFYSFDTDKIQFEFWQTGLYYSDPEVTFRIQYLAGNKRTSKQSNDRIIITASRNSAGIKALSQLIDVLMSLVREWYRFPYSQGHKHGPSGLKQLVPCFECVKLRRSWPFEFDIDQCLQAIVNDRRTIECSYFQGNSKKNHSVAIEDITPDLLFQDINPEYVLHHQDVAYQENEASLLGKGGYAEVYQGVFKDTRSIAAKKYLSRFSEQVLCELHFEAKMHCRFKHPCIIDFIGVCLHPLMVLLVEKAPLNSAAYPFLDKNTPISRLTVFRIATEVASALQYMHSQRIIYRDVKLANVLLWTLHPDSLCHCKLCDLNIAANLSPTGVRGLRGCKGFTAPELMHTGKGKQCSLYDHKADIFSYGMFLYQMIARRHPYHNIPTNRIDVAVEKGERPKLQNNNSYHYLTQLMKKCWDDNPTSRPEMREIVKNLCLSSMQMVMCMIPVQSKHSLRQALSISKNESSETENSLWVCCDSAAGVETRAYNVRTMTEVKKIHIRENQIQCMAHCGEHVWIATRTGVECGMVDIRNTNTMESVHKVHMQNKSVSCLATMNGTVYIGTSDGYCISYQSDMDRLKSGGVLPKESHTSECAVDGIVCTDENVWISHADRVSYLDLETLNIRGTITLEISNEMNQRAHVGRLACGVDHVMWGAHVGGTLLSAWNTQTKCHMYNVDTNKHIKRVTDIATDAGILALITAMTPVLNTVWVGMASGHILIFHENKLLSWFHLFEDYVHFLTCIPSSGPCGTEKCMVAIGGKNVKPLVPLCESKHKNDGSASCVVVWEAHNAKTLRQIKLIEEQSPGHLDNYSTVRHLIKEGDFKDGTNLGSDSSFQDRHFSIAEFNPIYANFPVGPVEEETSVTEELCVQLENRTQTIKLSCSKSAKLDTIVSEVQLMINLGHEKVPQLAYCIDGSQIMLKTQADLETYRALTTKPPLSILT